MMPRLMVGIGNRYGKLTVKRTNGTAYGGKRNWKCRCDGGRYCDADSTALVRGHKKSCGCLRSQSAARRQRTHGLAGSPTYVTWQGMLNRCRNENVKSFKDYGALGVTVCKRWYRFENFYADMGERPVSMTLDRKNPFGNYEKRNCKWATRSEQARNTRGAAALKILAKMQKTKDKEVA